MVKFWSFGGVSSLSEIPSFCFWGRGMPRIRNVSRSLELLVFLPSTAAMISVAKVLWFYNSTAVDLFGGISLVSQRTTCFRFAHAYFYCFYFCNSGSLEYLLCSSDRGWPYPSSEASTSL